MWRSALDGGEGGFEGLEVFDADDGDGFVDLAEETGEGAVGTEQDGEAGEQEADLNGGIA